MRFFGRGDDEDRAQRVMCVCQRCGTRYVLGVNAVATTAGEAWQGLQSSGGFDAGSPGGNVPDRIGLIRGGESWPVGLEPPGPSPGNPIPPAILAAQRQPSYRHWTCRQCGTDQAYPWCGGASPEAAILTAPVVSPTPAGAPAPLPSAYTTDAPRSAAVVTETLPLPTPEEARAVLVAHGATTAEQILRALNENDDALATAAATTLGELGDQSSVGRLIDLLNRVTIRRRLSTAGDAACVALGKLGGNRAVKELVELTQIPQRAGPAVAGLEIALTRHAAVLEGPLLSKVVGIPGIRYQRVRDGQVENINLDRTGLRDLARKELQRRSASGWSSGA